MASSKSIALVSLASFIVALVLVWVFVITNESQFDDNISLEIKFYKEKIPMEEKNIFILGSSEVGRINATYVNQILNENEIDYKAYNLGKPRDMPTDRLKVIESLIDAKPELVLYGIGFRDFGYSSEWKSTVESSVRSTTCEQLSTKNLLPSPKDVLPIKFLLENYYEELSPLGQPKQTTINTLRDILSIKSDKEFNDDQYSPFYSGTPRDAEIIPENNIQNILNDFCFHMNYELGSTQKIAIEKILYNLNKNNIKTVLFVTPHDKFFLKMLSNDERTNFELTLNELSNKYSIPIYSLIDKYHGMPVWNHFNHIAMNQSALIYSYDISNIIMENLS